MDRSRHKTACFGIAGLWLAFAVCLPITTFAAGEPTNAKESAAKPKTAPVYDKAADAKRKTAMSPEQLAWEKTLEECLGSFYLPIYKQTALKGVEQAWDYVKDDPKLPRILLIGDSISRGYTLAVRHALAGKVNVHRAPENCGSTANGLKKLSIWLGDGKWNVIHFNFGIHDRRTPPADYEQRLETIIERLKATGAKLVWASSTPLPPDGKDGDRDIVARNEIAARVVKRHGIAINDLYTFIKPRLAELQIPKDCHFKGPGYDLLGKKVTEEILAALGAK
ncbi:MAG: SGNH/GDSL hydrolase family protein [Verrucomicrobiia bacterium]